MTLFFLSSFALEHPGGIIGCKEKRAPMVLIVTLGQYHVGACFSVAQFIF